MKTKLKVLDLHTPAANDDVAAALALLNETLGEEQQRINNEGSAAMQGGDYDTATAVIDFAKRLMAFQQKVDGLIAEWAKLEDRRDTASPAVQKIVSQRFFRGRQMEPGTQRNRKVEKLDRDTPHSIDEDVTHKRPYGMLLQGRLYKDLTTWKSLYQQVLKHLATKDPTRFDRLHQSEIAVSRRGNCYFSRKQSDLRSPMPAGRGLYAEINLSAKLIRDRIADLLEEFSIPRQEIAFFLREDRDA